MSVVAGTYVTYQVTGNREDLSNVIYNISPEDTPFMSNIARMKATSTKTEWQTDVLAAAGANAQLEGDDATYTTPVNTTRVSNRTQISRKTLIVSGTQRSMNTAGREDEFEYQLAKKSAELKRDMEFILCSNQSSSAGSLAVVRTLGGLESWYTSNTQRGTNGTSGGFSAGDTSSAVDTTVAGLRTFVESHLKTAIRQAWSVGGYPTFVMTGPVNKQRASAFSGIATQYRDQQGKTASSIAILGGAGIYISDYGEHKIVANRFSRDNNVHVLDLDYWGVAYLRPFFTKQLAKTGDADKAMLLVEYTLVSKNEAANAVVADLFVGTA